MHCGPTRSPTRGPICNIGVKITMLHRWQMTMLHSLKVTMLHSLKVTMLHSFLL